MQPQEVAALTEAVTVTAAPRNTISAARTVHVAATVLKPVTAAITAQLMCRG